jgi:S-adenosylmethionine decarboxylase
MTSEYQFFGKHYLASYMDCDSKSLLNIDGLRQAMIKGINKSGATILSYTEKIFDNGGYTVLFLLSESHCSIHTYPENNAMFTDLFTCGEVCDYKGYEIEMINYLRPKKVTSDLVIRDETHHFS